ncbi:DUF4198 domain-containing protein [Flagellimonas oceani]|uniref:DUF4198 domain-containing protein n=1 Tax=Flagellimonas oceani TaxID=2698672 RepID=A0A6G7J093_9FLAO|nr:DUF4198 domain-containing protein [Allomuricauda oceani]QII44216.1 DUF4198 domain-containing protein [Allomuricauda oceani]
MKKVFFGLLAIVLLCSHDMFLKMDNYFLEPNTQAVIQLFNGTFEKSENVIDRNRMLDVSMVGNGKRIQVDSTQWTEKDSITFLNFKTGEPGTWVAGVSTAARNIALDAKSFNDYLEHDGVVDMLEWRKANNALDQDAVEKYSKHVKTIFQVGEKLSDDWGTALGYPIEFIPQENPYDIHPGHSIKVQLLYKGEPLANQLVIIGSETSGEDNTIEHSHDGGEPHTHASDGTADHDHNSGLQLRTDEAGILEFQITNEGVWHMRTIYMVQSTEEGLTHESNWATLTFAVGSGHSAAHDNDHEDDHHAHEKKGFSSYIFLIVSLIIVAGLFLYFKKKK